MRAHVHLYALLTKAANGQNLVVKFLRNLRAYPRFPEISLGQSNQRNPRIEMDLCDWYPEIQDAMALFEHYVRQIRDECRNHGVPFAAFCIQGSFETDDASWLKATTVDPAEPTCYERNKGVREVERILDRAGIPHFSVMEGIRALPDPTLAYYVFDGHFSELGNRLVAERVAAYIRETHLKDCEGLGRRHAGEP